MKPAVILPFLILVYLSACKQGNSGAKQGDLKDTAKVRIYEQKSIAYEDKAPDSAIYFAREGLALARNLHDLTGQAMLLSSFARINEKYGNYELALKYQQEALDVYKQQGNRGAAIEASAHLGILNTKLNDFETGKDLLKEALSSHQEQKDTDGMIRAHTRLGEASALSGDTDKALEYYAKAQKFHQARPLAEDHLALLHTIGRLHSERGDHAKALKYFKEGISRTESSNFKQAHLAFIRQAGNMSDSLGDKNQALRYHQEGLRKARQFNLPEEEARALLGMASAIKDKDADQSVQHLKNALSIARSIGHKKLAAEIHYSLSGIYRQQAKYQESIQALQEHHRLIDSLENAEKGHKLMVMQHSYDLAESKLRIESLELINNKRTYERNAGILAALAILIILVILGAYYNRTRLLNKRLHESNLIKDKLFSIIGHDLRNPIGGITQLLAMMEEGDLSAEERDQLISEMRKQGDVTLEILNALLNWGEAQLKGVHVKPSNFTPAAISSKNIAALSKQAADKSIVVKDEISSGLTVHGDANHFDFILRNLLSNAIKFSPVSGTITIAADIHASDGFVTFSVKDEGKGVSKQQQELFQDSNMEISFGTKGEKGTGIGLMLSKEFIKANGGHIRIGSEEGKGATFYFSFRQA